VCNPPYKAEPVLGVYLNLVEGLLWVQDVEGSNPFTPTTSRHFLPSVPGLCGPSERTTMSNRALWDVRKRHIWLATPATKCNPKLRTRKRCGLQAAIERKAPKVAAEGASSDS
jgi:hypothetical protein